MSETPWTKEEFLAYILLYGAHADVDYKEEENSYIHSKIAPGVYYKVLAEFSKDNDYDRVQKIIGFQAAHPEYSPDWIVAELEGIFKADQDFDQVEHVFLATIKKIFA